MEEQLISFETAKLAKEKGFDIPCENFYTEYIDDDVVDLFNYEEQRGSSFAELYRNNKEFKFSAPTQSLLQRWLREVHDIIVLVHQYTETKTYFYLINQEYDFEYDDNKLNCKTYEEALEIGLQESLKLIE